MPQQNSYEVVVRTGSESNSGTDDPVFIILYGPEGSTGKLRLNTKKDDFPTKGASSFLFNFDEYDVSDVGNPFAITLILEGGDALFVNLVDVYYRPSGGVQQNTFIFNGALGHKGDFGLADARPGVTLFRDNYISEPTDFPISRILDELWIVVDNRSNDSAITTKFEKEWEIELSRFYGEITTESHELHYGFAVTVNKGWFGNNYKFAVEHTYTSTEEITDSNTLTKRSKVTVPIDIITEAGKLGFYPYKISGEARYQNYTIGRSIKFNLDVLDGDVDLAGVAVKASVFNSGEDIPDNLKQIYGKYLGETFSIQP